MGLLACVNIPRLKLQLYGRRCPQLRNRPMGVISEDRPLGIVLEANRTALAEGVRPGMRYAAALSLVPALQAAAISESEVEETVLTLSELLLEFSPSVEPARIGTSQICAGVFWLNAEGLTRIFGSPAQWAAAICRALGKNPAADVAAPGFSAVVAVGTTHFGTYAAARMFRENTVFESLRQEQEIIRRVPLRILPFDPRTTDILFNLGLHTVRDFISLPYGGVRKRFGEDAAAVHRFVQGLGTLPVQTLTRTDPLSRTRRFAAPMTNKTYVIVAAVQLLGELHEESTRRRQLIKEMELTLTLEPGGGQDGGSEPLRAVLRPATPTCEQHLLAKLLRLRMEDLVVPDPVETISLSFMLQHTHHTQADLFMQKPARDPSAADKAFALIRAELGNDAVCVARILPEHLPRDRYNWEPVEHVISSRRSVPTVSLTRVRRLFGSPETIPMLRPAAKRDGSTDTLHFSGTWWGAPYQVEYRYFRAGDGAVLWLARERQNGEWIIQGSVE